MTPRATFTLLAAALLFACTRQPPAEQKMQEAADQMGQAVQEMQRALTGNVSGDKKPVPPVPFRDLMTHLPTSMPGMTADEPEGSTNTMGEWSYSEASVDFRSDDGRHAEVKISDLAHIGLLYAPYRMMLGMNIRNESTRGYERTVEVEGFPAFEEWKTDGGVSRVAVLVGDRFATVVETRGMGEGSAMKIARDLGLKRLAARGGG